jgi:hypothetical protein
MNILCRKLVVRDGVDRDATFVGVPYYSNIRADRHAGYMSWKTIQFFNGLSYLNLNFSILCFIFFLIQIRLPNGQYVKCSLLAPQICPRRPPGRDLMVILLARSKIGARTH